MRSVAKCKLVMQPLSICHNVHHLLSHSKATVAELSLPPVRVSFSRFSIACRVGYCPPICLCLLSSFWRPVFKPGQMCAEEYTREDDERHVTRLWYACIHTLAISQHVYSIVQTTSIYVICMRMPALCTSPQYCH